MSYVSLRKVCIIAVPSHIVRVDKGKTTVLVLIDLSVAFDTGTNHFFCITSSYGFDISGPVCYFISVHAFGQYT